MPDTISNLFGCCCNNVDRMAVTALYAIEHGFPPFDATYPVATYITSGNPPYGPAENWVATPNLTLGWEAMFKFLCVGSYSSFAPAGWTMKDGVTSFSVGDLVHKAYRNSGGTYEYHKFYRCKAATSIGGDPQGLPDYFQAYDGNRYVPLNLTGPVRLYSTPLFHYTPMQVYKTWTEVTKAYDAASTEVVSYTRQTEMDDLTGSVSVIVAHPGYTSDVIDLPATATPAFLSVNYYPTYTTAEWNISYSPVQTHYSNLQFELIHCAFPYIPLARMIFTDGFFDGNIPPKSSTDDTPYFWGVLTDFTVTATECFFEFTITVPWSTTEYKDIIVTQTITLSDALVFQDKFDEVYAGLPAIASYDFYDTYTLDEAGAAELVTHNPWPYLYFGNRNYGLYQNEVGLVDYGFRFPTQGSGSLRLNKPTMRRLKYVMETDPHWVKTQVAGEAVVSTEYNTSPLTHTFDPAADQEPEVVRVVLTAGG